MDFYGYGCQLFDVNVSDPSVTFTFTGDHDTNRNDSDVVVLDVYDSEFRFIPQEIFTSFPNIHTIEVYESNLQSINVSGTDKLLRFTASYNNISRIQNGVFASQVNISHISLNNNRIVEIEENAFNGLNRLQRLFLIGNGLPSFPSGLFNNTPALHTVDFGNNRLTRIENQFSNLRNLRYLWLEYNRIDAIAPSLTSPFANSINIIGLTGNICIDDEFSILGNEFSIILFNVAASRCFENHSPRNDSDERRLSMEFTGRMNIYDSFDNLIGVINNN